MNFDGIVVVKGITLVLCLIGVRPSSIQERDGQTNISRIMVPTTSLPYLRNKDKIKKNLLLANETEGDVE
jgi:hypothetical protein